MFAFLSRSLRIAAIGLLPAALAAAAEPDLPLFGDLRPGPQLVGFRIVSALTSPAGPGETPRLLDVALWYPSSRSADEPMRFGEYLGISPDLREKSVGPPGEPSSVVPTDLAATLSVAVTGDPKGLSPELVEKILAAPMLARRDATPASGRFPLVFWGSRYGTAAAQAVLCEWLASQGFVVAFGRPRDERWKMPFELSTPAEKATELDQQVRDLRGALQAVRERGEVDAERTFLVTWSYAGEAVFALSRSDPRIRGVVAMSTNLLDRWVYAPPEAIPAIPDGPLEVPVLLVDEARTASGEPRVAPPSLAALPPGSARLVLPGLAHGNFNLLEGMVPGLYGLSKVQRWSRGGPEARTGYEAVTRLGGLWMRQILGDAAAAAERDRVLASLPSGFARYEAVAARPRPSIAETDVSFRSADGLVVTGRLYRPPDGVPARACLLLAHQSGSSRGEYAVIGPELARRGYVSLAVDLRWGRRDKWAGEWNSTARRAGSLGRLESADRPAFGAILAGARADLAAAETYLAGQGCRDGVVLWGSSFSANAVLERAAEAPAGVRAVVSFSPGEYDKDKPGHMQGVARAVSVPVLVVWGFDEEEGGMPKIVEAVPGARSGFASKTGIHGSSILFQDPLAWTALWRFLDGLPAR